MTRLIAPHRCLPLAAAALLAFTSSCGSPRGSSPGDAPFPPDGALRDMLRQLVERGPTRGVVVGMLEADGTRRVVAWGDPGEGALPLGPESVFEIGSITKVFTGILLADMVRRGEVELSDPVAEHLPPDVRVPTRGGREITLLDLTTHHAALPMMPPDLAPADPLDPFRDYTVERLYRTVSGYAPEREPGSGFLYSNVGVALLGRPVAGRGSPQGRQTGDSSSASFVVRRMVLVPAASMT